MGYKITLAPSARRDLKEIIAYISLDNPARAVSFGKYLASSVDRLADFPEIGRVVPDFEDKRVREIVVRAYRVIYRVDHDIQKVRVLRFWHGARGTPIV